MVLGVFLVNIRGFGQMFQVCRLTGAVVDMHGVLAVLCSLAGVCELVFLGAAGTLVAGGTRGGLEEALLGTGSPCALSSSGLESGGAVAALPRFYRFCFVQDLRMQTRCLKQPRG